MCKKCQERPDTFNAPQWTVSQVRDAIPKHCFDRDTSRSLYYLARDAAMSASLAYGIQKADNFLGAYRSSAPRELSVYVSAARLLAWCLYWWFQGLTFTGLWVVAHECGHGAFSSSPITCDTIGFVLHSFLGTPYYSWKYSHRQHHRYNAHMEKDEHWVPRTKATSKEGAESEAGHGDSGLWESVEDTPLFQLAKLLFQQAFGFQAYLLFNVSGQPDYPRWTNHFDPYSILFRPSQRGAILLSDLGILSTLVLLTRLSSSAAHAARLYGVPWLLLSHWIMMIVFLQHTDAAVPHYRAGAWTRGRGALATVDRAFLGWQGAFFLHSVAHFHVVHHFFPKMPFYHLEEATAHAKEVLGQDYYACDTPVFRALWENYVHCQYVDAHGDIVFYKDKAGSARHRVPSLTQTGSELPSSETNSK
ncbi:fatty acid desaturase-domain-containing protein [Phellopilus nigrolimitatus]|nr:fatty acid desaturase-domain-containing protein [Phellopilus nigrolimitatus]